mgnify:CR=1 FL=1
MAIKAGQLKERADYQAYILEMLREENAYQVRPSTAYDPGYGMDAELLFSFRSNPTGCIGPIGKTLWQQDPPDYPQLHQQ